MHTPSWPLCLLPLGKHILAVQRFKMRAPLQFLQTIIRSTRFLKEKISPYDNLHAPR